MRVVWTAGVDVETNGDDNLFFVVRVRQICWLLRSTLKIRIFTRAGQKTRILENRFGGLDGAN